MQTLNTPEKDYAAEIESILWNDQMLLAYPRGRHAAFNSTPAKVTVVVPVYNAEARLQRCLQSIADQTLKEYQVIIVDNNSNDASLSIACKFASENPKFMVYQNPVNVGRVGNWNRCLDLANGEYIKPVMVNDYLLPACLEELGHVLDSYPDVALARVSVTILDKGQWHFGPLFDKSRLFTSEEAIRHCLTVGSIAAGPTAQMFRRTPIRFDTTYEWAADFEFAMRLLEWGDFYYLRQSLFVFEITNRFATQTRIHQELRDELEVLGSSLDRYQDRLDAATLEGTRTRADSLHWHYKAKCSTLEEQDICASLWESAVQRFPLLLTASDASGTARTHKVIGSKIKSSAASPNEKWESAVPDEVKFWDDWCKTRGGKWNDEFEFRLSPDSELQSYITQFVDTLPGGTLRLLDVGCGPLTDLGKRWENRTVELTAVDPLANYYNGLLKKYGHTAPVPALPIGGESLAEELPLNHFDMVYARNSIDHSVDAPRTIDQMLAVLKPGGVMFMAHYISEATAAANDGLHGWNFFAEGSDFIVEKFHGEKVNITQRYMGIAKITCEALPEKRWITVHMRKLVSSEIDNTEPAPVQSLDIQFPDGGFAFDTGGFSPVATLNVN